MNSSCPILKKAVSSVICFFLLCLLPSCGYQLGSLMHPQIKSVAIADVKNETLEVGGSAILRGLLADRFQFDNSLKVTTLDKADCVVYAKILSVTVQNIVLSSTDEDKTFRPSLFQLTARVEYTVRIPGQAKNLITSRTETKTATYQYTHDPALGKKEGMRQAFLQIADRIVHAVTEGW